MKKTYQAPTVKKAFQILRLISDSENGLGISDISRALDLSKGTVAGITAGLEEEKALVRDPGTKRFSLGLTLFELGRASFSRAGLAGLARPVMEDLMEKVEESVFLGAKNGDRVTIIDVVESRQDMKITSPVGTTMPLLAGATGKVFLSRVEKERVEELIRKRGLRSYTENTITDPGLYLEELKKVRKLGYATDYEEYLPGVRAVVYPVDGQTHFSTAIWVVGFKASLDDEKMVSVIDETGLAAQEISRLFRI